MSRISSFIIFTASTVLTANFAQAVVIYSQDWEGGVAGQSINAAPYNFTPQDGANWLVQTTTPLGSDLNVAQRTAVDGGGTSGNASIAITPPTLAPGTKYTLTAKINLPAGGTSNGFIGLAKSSIGTYNNAGIFVGNGGGVIDVDSRGVGGAVLQYSQPESNPFLSTLANPVNLDVTVELDIDTSTVKTTFSNGVDAPLISSFVGANFSGLNRFVIEQFGPGINVGNILITETGVAIPEPSSIMLGSIALAGLAAGNSRRRARRKTIS